MRYVNKAFAIAAAGAGLAAVLFSACVQSEGSSSDEIPAFVTWKEKSVYADLTGDGTEEMITLKDRRLEADRIDGSLLYESRSEWQISDFLIHDIDQDGRNELLMLAWRIGSYGTSRPFWEDEEAGEDHYSQHIFIFRYEEDRVRAVWMSSETGIDIRDWEIGDEGRLVLVDAAGEKSRWFWDSWGLTKADP